MVRRVSTLFHREIRGLHEAAYLVAIASFASQVLALLRDRLFAHTLGAGSELDLYYAAFRVPDIVFVTVASFVSVNVLIPHLAGFLSDGTDESRARARAFLSDILSAFFLLMFVVIFAVFIFAPALARLVAPGFSAGDQEELSFLMRILMLSPLFLGLSNILGGVTQSFRRFYVYALSPLFYNAAIIGGIILLYPRFGLPGLIWGVVCGAMLHALVQVPLLRASRLSPRVSLSFDARLVKGVLASSLPRTIALGLSQIVFAILLGMASYMEEGSISIVSLAFNLQSVPLALIGASYSVAAFPALSQLFSEGKREAFAQELSRALRHVIFLSLPLSGIVIVLREPIVRVVLGSGRFGASDIERVSSALGIFALSLAAQGTLLLLVRAYYAARTARRPLAINTLSSFATIAVAALGVKFGFPGDRVLALPLALSFGAILNAAALLFFFQRDFPEFPSLRRTALEGLGAAVFGSLAAFFSNRLFPLPASPDAFLSVLVSGGFSGLLGCAASATFLYLSGSREFAEIVQYSRRRLQADRH